MNSSKYKAGNIIFRAESDHVFEILAVDNRANKIVIQRKGSDEYKTQTMSKLKLITQLKYHNFKIVKPEMYEVLYGKV